MAQFIHLFDQRNENKIRKNGIIIFRTARRNQNGIYVFPQTENYIVNHQWLRELRRWQGINMLAARIRIPDKERVLIGKYNQNHIEASASEAINISRQHSDPMGLEVIIQRKISPQEIIAIYKPLKIIGWRYHPNAKGNKPCGCSYCQRGEPYSRGIKQFYGYGI